MIMTDAEVSARFGKPGNDIIQIPIAYPMRIAWDTNVVVNKVWSHKLCADNFTNLFKDLLAHYGLPELQKLGIDLFGGTYNMRLMRGSKTRWSRHSWAIAIDLDPARNQLKWDKTKAQFAKPEYKDMVDIFYKNGFVGYGPEKNYDWMHFEISK